VISAVPIKIECSGCRKTLLEAHLDIETTDEIDAAWMLVDYINVVCPDCRNHLNSALDDLTRIFEGFDEL